MKISVVTVCYNAAKTIKYTLESFAEQTLRDKELLLIDGGSTDGTLTIARDFASENVQLFSERDNGIYDAMNKGLRLYTGDAIGFLNADDRFKGADALSRIAVALSEADAAHGSLDFVADHADGRIVRRWRARDFRSGAFAKGWMPAHPTFYLRRSLAQRVGSFDVRYKIAADYDFMLRALELFGARVRTVEGVLVDMMAGGTSTSNAMSHLRHNLEALRSRQQWLGAGPIDYALFAKPIQKIGQFLSFGRNG